MKLLKKGLAFISAAALLLSGNILTTSVREEKSGLKMTAYAENPAWDGTEDNFWYDGEEFECHISTAEDFAGFAKMITDGNPMTNQTIILDNDIYINELVDMDQWETKAPENVWKYESASDTFDGIFEGNGHTIYGFYSEGCSLFNSNSGEIKNLSVKRAVVKSTSAYKTGVLCNDNKGKISDCSIEASVKLGKDSNSYYSPRVFSDKKIEDITEKEYHFGMFCSENSGTLTNLKSSGSITLDSEGKSDINLGGICSESTGEISVCKNDTEITAYTYSADKLHIGGICAAAGGGTISDCVNLGKLFDSANPEGYTDEEHEPKITTPVYPVTTAPITILEPSYTDLFEYERCIGGIAGESMAPIINCTNNGNVSGGVYTAGIVGRSCSDVYNTLNSATVKGNFYCGGIMGINTDSLKIFECANNGKISNFDNTDYNGRARFTNGNKTARYCGGLIGAVDTRPLNIYYCYNKGDINGLNYAGGIAGNSSYTLYMDAVYNTGNVTGTNADGLILSDMIHGINCYTASDDENDCYYFDSTGQRILKSPVNMKKEVFADTLGNAFFYNEAGYPALYWEVDKEYIVFDKTKLVFSEYMEQQKLTAECKSSDNPITLESSDEKIATVDNNGTVTAIGNGSCIITASIGKTQVYCNVTVNYDYYINESAFKLDIDTGKTIPVYSKATDELVNPSKIVYTSDDEEIASVNSKGVVYGNKPGITNINISVGDVKLTCKVAINTLSGDVNEDSYFNVADIILLQKWLLAYPDAKLDNWKAADMCRDNILNVLDLCAMKRALLG